MSTRTEVVELKARFERFQLEFQYLYDNVYRMDEVLSSIQKEIERQRVTE